MSDNKKIAARTMLKIGGVEMLVRQAAERERRKWFELLQEIEDEFTGKELKEIKRELASLRRRLRIERTPAELREIQRRRIARWRAKKRKEAAQQK
jgi:hypothetical protein